jgi:5'-3' exonuclease
MKEDAAWQQIKVIFSGAEVPGEGEHKIMLFIRNMKMQKGYEPNIRHCLYGTRVSRSAVACCLLPAAWHLQWRVR